MSIGPKEEIRPTEVAPTETVAEDVKPTEIKPTGINPTKIEPTGIEATSIKPTPIVPGNGSKRLALFVFLAWTCSSVALLAFTLFLGFSFSYLVLAFLTAFLLIWFVIDLRKTSISQEGLDIWNSEILRKNPNFKKENLMTMADSKKMLNKFSIWLHQYKSGALKASLCVLGAVAVFSLVFVPVSIFGNFASSPDPDGIYLSITRETAWKFDDDNSVFYSSYVDGENYSWENEGVWTRNRNAISWHSNRTDEWGYNYTATLSFDGSSILYSGEVVYSRI